MITDGTSITLGSSYYTCAFYNVKLGAWAHLLLVFSVKPFKINQNKNRIFAYSSKRELSNIRSGTRLTAESETGERRRLIRLTGVGGRRLARIRLLRYALPISVLILRKKPTVLQSNPEGHQHCGRKPTETSVTEFCYKSTNLFFEELRNTKVILFLTHKLFR